MANIENQKFITLDISGKNYLSRVLDVKLHLSAKKLRQTIDEDNAASNEERATALIFLRHHIDDGLKYEYLTVENLLELWQNLNNRFEHLKAVTKTGIQMIKYVHIFLSKNLTMDLLLLQYMWMT
ncbi:hypothetical protein CFOL_v3_04100 [Cephalotus follicularis]|uniref:UBN2 domain-containing protein n=1 Tax=Cephalotus follicularis TaxID=3775 RepID=A0A1Q3AXY3_CEPFO|nr:hypothetical protein CFOL_v3_04100 [Cephalotus follicularis]